MTDLRYAIGGNVSVWWGLTNAFTNPQRPTVSEVNALLNLTPAVSFNDSDFGAEASNTLNDPSWNDMGNFADRGAAQYGGNLSFYYPKTFDDNSSKLSLVYDALDLPGTQGYLVIRMDGELPDSTKGETAAAAGDFVTVYKVQTDAYQAVAVGEDAFRQTISFVPKGELISYTVLGTSAPTVTITGPTTADEGDILRLYASIGGRNVTTGVVWATSTPALATITNAGVVEALDAGSASFTATDPRTGTASTAKSITIS